MNKPYEKMTKAQLLYEVNSLNSEVSTLEDRVHKLEEVEHEHSTIHHIRSEMYNLCDSVNFLMASHPVRKEEVLDEKIRDLEKTIDYLENDGQSKSIAKLESTIAKMAQDHYQ